MDLSKRLKTYQEAVVVAALHRAYPGGQAAVHWNEPLGPGFIDPDVTLGRRADRPDAVLSVAHSDSEKESDKKFWRNAAELALCKARLPHPPLVLSLLFEDHYKPALLKSMAGLFDVQVRLLEDLGLRRLVHSGPELTAGPLRGISPRQAFSYLETSFLSDPAVRAELGRLAGWLKQTIGSGAGRHGAYWKALRGRVPSAETLAGVEFEANGPLRRGASKLLCFDPDRRAAVLRAAAGGKLEPIEEFAFGLGWAARLRDRGRIVDDDLVALARSFEAGAVLRALDGTPAAVRTRMERVAVRPCREVGVQARSMLGFYERHEREFRGRDSLLRLLRRCHLDPTMGGEVEAARRPWLLEFGLAAGKAVRGTAQGYGLAKLAREVRCGRPEGVRFWAPDYNRGGRLPPEAALGEMARVLAGRFGELAKQYGRGEEAGRAVLKWLHHTLVEVKLCTYRLFRPAETLFAQACLASGIEVSPYRLPAAGPCPGRPRRMGTDGLLLVRSPWRAFAKIQSGSRNTHDKAKELCGRIALSLRHTGRTYEPVFEHTLLVLDGPFSRTEALLCRAAGWGAVVALDRVDRVFLDRLPALFPG